VSDIITDAELIQQFAAKAMEEPAVEITTRAPSASEVKLPGGFINSEGDLVTTAEVKELTGADEEAVAKAGTTGKALNILLQRGIVKLGSEEASKDDLDALLSGDRDAILVGIRRVTFGDTISYDVRCLVCGDEHQQDIDLIVDVPTRTIEDAINDRVWEVETKQGTAELTLPTGTLQKKLIENADRTAAEINTILLGGCLLSLGGRPSVGAKTALGLGMADRNNLIDEILKRNPGPRLGEVTKTCKACGEDIPLPLSLVELFRL
jgi:hypothetical protein